MQNSEIEQFRDMLLLRGQNLNDWLNSGAAGRGGNANKVRELLQQIRRALERIENDAFGVCKICHGEIEKGTLECHPETEICIDCLSHAEKEALEGDLKTAGKIQRAFMPQSLPQIPDFSVAARWYPASQVGGDYYDFLPCGGDVLSRVIIADAMGKGISGSLVISSLHGALRVLSADIHSPGELLQRLNHWLCRNVPITKFISMVCLCLEDVDREKTTLTFANGGHPQPLLVRANGTIEQLEATGGVLGVHEGFDYFEGKTYLATGDLLLLYTDGVTELTDRRGEMFGEEQLMSFVADHRNESVENITENLVAELLTFAGSTNQFDDDLTLVCLRKM